LEKRVKLRFRSGENSIEIEATRVGPAWLVRLAEREADIAIETVAGRDTGYRIAGEDSARVWSLPCEKTERGVEISYQGRTYVFTEPTRAGASRESKRGSGSLVAPMVGIVADVYVSVGDTVEAYQTLAVVEAMKVMATIEAPFNGHVEHVHVKKGDQLAHGAPMIDVVPEPADGESTG
jgi:3-methylcrotonyl-CoA carboxylase alpha subunit